MNLVTGGDGYIGGNLLRKLDDGFSYDLKNGYDVLDRESLETWISESNSVYHLSAVSGISSCETDPIEAFKANVMGTLNVSELCGEYGVPFVFASSFAVKTEPMTYYGMTKLVCESLVTMHGGSVCRIANVYGGYRYMELKNTAVARLMKGTWEDRGHSDEVRLFVHVDEVCDWLVECLGRCGVHEPGFGRVLSIGELVQLSRVRGFPDIMR